MRKLLIVIGLVIASRLSSAHYERGTLGVGLNYPGIGVRFFPLDHLGIEARGQFDSEIKAWGLRGSWYGGKVEQVHVYGGLEGDYLRFDGEESRGNGWAASAFLGGEVFVTRGLAVQLDFGPAFVSLKDTGTAIAESGMEAVINIGVVYYF
jgi:hypothetical protein